MENDDIRDKNELKELFTFENNIERIIKGAVIPEINKTDILKIINKILKNISDRWELEELYDYSCFIKFINRGGFNE